MNQGWIKLWRKSLDSGLLKKHRLWAFWTYCLLKATHKETTVVVGCQQIMLRPGQLIIGRKKAAEETGLSEQEVRTCIALLIKWKNITSKPTNKFTIITIANWGLYQSDNLKSTSKSTSNQPAVNHIQEQKNEKNIIYSEKLSWSSPEKMDTQLGSFR
jgi:hypothetical protein